MHRVNLSCPSDKGLYVPAIHTQIQAHRLFLLYNTFYQFLRYSFQHTQMHSQTPQASQQYTLIA